MRVAALTVTVAASAAPVANGDFQTGDLTGWIMFLTAEAISPGPAVVSFDTTGSGESNAAMLAVGRNTGIGAPEGGGVYQSVSTPAGSFNVSADVAAQNPYIENQSCGLFELLVDGVVVDSRDFTAGDFSVGVPVKHDRPRHAERDGAAADGRFTRGEDPDHSRVRPYSSQRQQVRQYVDNVSRRRLRRACRRRWVSARRAAGRPTPCSRARATA